jgi:outer membrane lipoprotein carrier protein
MPAKRDEMKKAILIFSLLSCFSAWGKAPIKKSKVAKSSFSLSHFAEKYRAAKTLEADFTQEVYQATLAKIKTSSGTIALSKPNRIRWETHQPEKSVMVSNGRKLWFYNPNQGAKGQVIEHSATYMKSQPLFRLLSGEGKLEEEFQLINAKPLENGFDFSLKPRRPSGDLERVQILTDRNYLISMIILNNRSGNKTKISLQNLGLDSKLLSVLFDFTPPPDAEIVKAD